MPALFDPGRVVATPAALDALAVAGVPPAGLLARHLAGDWGELCPEDVRANAEALVSGARLMSAYTLPNGTRVWVITDGADDQGRRPATTLLLPSDY